LNKTKALLAQYNIAIIFIFLVIAASFISADFFTQRNVTNVLRQSAVVGISSMGMLLVILTRGIDLSVGSVSACGSVFSAYFLSTMPAGGSIAAAIAIGCLMGALSGYLVAARRMPPFVVTLGMMTIARGTAFIVSKGQPILVGEKGKILTDFGKGLTFGVADPVILMLAVFGIVWFLLHFTAFGRLVTAIGSNEEAVRLSGINIGWYTFATYVISGGLSALAGVVNTARSGVGSPVLGTGMELDVIAAVVIGGASLMGGRGTALNALLGVLILAVIGNIMNLENVPGYHQEVVKGVIILVAVLFQSGLWTGANGATQNK
jgi:ribose/xylose/arabinose/galactoside ABC-type transport system permease subunit